MSTEEAKLLYSTTLELPEGVEARLVGSTLSITGPLGQIMKDFSKMPVSISLESKKVLLRSSGSRKKDLATLNTTRSIVRNMLVGLTKGFTYRLKLVFAHFPISVKSKGKEVLIENFYGERSPRVAKLIGDCRVSVEGDDLVVRGVSLEDVGQTAANIEKATTVRRKDQRVFLDGIYVYRKETGW